MQYPCLVNLELLMGLEPMTSSLPRKCSTTELQQLVGERVKGIEPSYSAWKAAALPLSYTRFSILTDPENARKATSGWSPLLIIR